LLAAHWPRSKIFLAQRQGWPADVLLAKPGVAAREAIPTTRCAATACSP